MLSHVQGSVDPSVRPLKKLGLRSFVCHPLLTRNKLIGTLSFGSRTRDQFAPDEIEFTQTLAQYVAVAIDRSRKVEELFAAQREMGMPQGRADLNK